MRIGGARVALRPFREDEVNRWWEARLHPDYADQPGGTPTRKAVRARVARSGNLDEGRLDLAIEAEGRLVGEIQTYQPPRGRRTRGGYELGVGLFSDEDRGRGYGSEAVALLLGWLFEHAGARRVSAATRPGNASMRRLLERQGFTVERTVQEGARTFLVYAVTPERWQPPKARPAD